MYTSQFYIYFSLSSTDTSLIVFARQAPSSSPHLREAGPGLFRSLASRSWPKVSCVIIYLSSSQALSFGLIIHLNRFNDSLPLLLYCLSLCSFWYALQSGKEQCIWLLQHPGRLNFLLHVVQRMNVRLIPTTAVVPVKSLLSPTVHDSANVLATNWTEGYPFRSSVGYKLVWRSPDPREPLFFSVIDTLPINSMLLQQFHWQVQTPSLAGYRFST